MHYREIANNYKIDIISFLRNYCQINDISLKQNTLKHDDLPILFPYINKYLVRKSYDYALKHLSLITKGDILIVYDCTHQLIVYENPINLMMKEEKELVYHDVPSMINYEENRDVNLPDISPLSKDELLTIRSRLRKDHNFQYDRYLTSEIRKRKRKEPHKYREKKEQLYEDVDIEEMNYYVKH